MISIESIGKQFPEKVLFSNLSFKLNEGIRLGLVGANGSGKTTLLKILLDLESPDTGHVDIGKSVSIGYLPQEIVAGTERNILEETLAAYPEVSEIEQKIYTINNKLSITPNDAKLLLELSDLQNTFDQIDGWDIEKKAKIILSGLGFRKEDFHKPFNTFSGGWRMRCYLAGILLKRPNYLFLDEPSNHLDLHAIIWMEDFLSKWKGGLVMISHDRNFLDKSINTILELRQGDTTLYSGNYSYYTKKREEHIQHREKAYNNQQKYIAEKERFIERFRAKNTKSKQVQSRIKQLEKLDRIQLIENNTKSISINIPQPNRGPLKVVDLINIKKTYDDTCVYTNLNLTIERGQKIALVGENGSGKSTLLKMLASIEKPTDGNIIFGPKVIAHYFAQHQLENLDQNATIYNSIFSISKGWSETQIRTYLGSFLFKNDAIQKKVKILSGGEKSRLALAKMLVEPSHLLLLDEPTNHLDIESRDIIENALQSYNGTLVCISHDRHFLNSATNITIEVENNTIQSFAGNYDYFVWKKNQDSPAREENVSTKKPRRQHAYKERKMRRNEYARVKKRISIVDKELKYIAIKLENKDIHSDYEKLQSLQHMQNTLEIEYLELIEKQEEIEKLM